MHTRLLALVAACAAPVPAAAQVEGAEEFDDAQLFLDPSRVEWVLDDGAGTDEVPWDGVDRGASYLPLGQTHFGVQLRVAALPGGTPPQMNGPLVEVAGIFDQRYARTTAWRIRAALALSYQPHSEEYLGAGTATSTSPLALRLRVMPISIDLGQWIVVRAGGDFGVQWTPTVGGQAMRTDLFGAFGGELAALLFDGLLEIGAAGGLQFTAIATTSRSGASVTMPVQPVVGGFVGYLLP